MASAVAAGVATVAVPLHIPLPPSTAYTLWPEGLQGRVPSDLAPILEAHASGVAR